MPTAENQTRKKVRIVASREFIDKETGEIINAKTVLVEDRDANFHKLWLANLMDAMEMFGSKRLKIVMWLLNNAKHDNMVIATQKEIAKGAGCSIRTVTDVMQTLVANDFLKRKQNGVYVINPAVIWKGGRGERVNVLWQYRQIDEPTV